jgi:hypothetical protein
MGMIAASLLLFCPEEESFWMMCSIIENLLPVSYFSSNLWGAQVTTSDTYPPTFAELRSILRLIPSLSFFFSL